jgi:RimJ/RimL family protein N-acetyltransferase
MAGRIAVRAVESRADATAFLGLPYALYRFDPHWVPPLRTAERRRWSPRHNATLRSRWVRRFVAWRDGCPVGRVAAVVDGAFAARWYPSAGFFGFFECVDDDVVSDALFAAAEAALAERGVRAVLGPVNLSTQDEVGLVVAGFDLPPTLLSPCNPPYYERLVERAGFVKLRDYHAYAWTPGERRSALVDRVVAAAARRAGDYARLVLRPADPGRWDDEVRTLHRLYNAAFDGVWGFVPISWDEFVQRAEEFKAFYRPELVIIAEVGGEPAGFGLLLPDINEALPGLNGRLLPFGWLRLMRRVRRIGSGRLVLLGVLPRFTGRGLAALIADRMIEPAGKAGLRRVELSLVLEDNRPMRHVIEAFGCRRVKVFRLYEKSLGEPPEPVRQLGAP